MVFELNIISSIYLRRSREVAPDINSPFSFFFFLYDLPSYLGAHHSNLFALTKNSRRDMINETRRAMGLWYAILGWESKQVGNTRGRSWENGFLRVPSILNKTSFPSLPYPVGPSCLTFTLQFSRCGVPRVACCYAGCCRRRSIASGAYHGPGRQDGRVGVRAPSANLCRDGLAGDVSHCPCSMPNTSSACQALKLIVNKRGMDSSKFRLRCPCL